MASHPNWWCWRYRPACRSVVSEHGSDVEEADRLRQVVHSVFDVRAADGRRAFGAQSQRLAAEVVEGVHFFLDDVGFVADAAAE